MSALGFFCGHFFKLITLPAAMVPLYMFRSLAIILLVISILSFTPQTHALEKVAGSTGQLMIHSIAERSDPVDMRVLKLQAYFEKYNSPLAPYADIFVQQADEHALDWKLVASIAGLESTFGKFIPQGSYNAWGWGIPTGASKGLGFSDWEDGIATVSEGLKQKYVDRGLTTPEQMGRIYAASPTWASKIYFFMNEIEKQQIENNAVLAMNL